MRSTNQLRPPSNDYIKTSDKAHATYIHKTKLLLVPIVLERVKNGHPWTTRLQGIDPVHWPLESKYSVPVPMDVLIMVTYRFHAQNVYLLYHVCIAVFTLDAGLLARSQYSEGPVTGHLDTGFFWFPCVYKQMLRWFPRFQVATTCLSCSPPDLN